MNGIRVLGGRCKGPIIPAPAGKRRQWDISGPRFGGREIDHFKDLPTEPDRLYASQGGSGFGPGRWPGTTGVRHAL